MADVFEWGAICIFLCSGVIEYLVPVGEVCIRVDLCQTLIGRNDKVIRNDNGKTVIVNYTDTVFSLDGTDVPAMQAVCV